mgnify:CR=1 FL=1
MHLLKGVVIGLGVLIFLGLALMAYGFIQKANNPNWRLLSSSPAPSSAPLTVDSKPFADITLNLPKGCVIAGVRPDGGRAYLNIAAKDQKDAAACDRVIVVDTVQGRVLGTIKARSGITP